LRDRLKSDRLLGDVLGGLGGGSGGGIMGDIGKIAGEALPIAAMFL